jgi:hypothetical protein
MLLESMPRRALSFSERRRNAARVLAPHGPADKPLESRYTAAECASKSETVKLARRPLLRMGQAVVETVPQSRPAMIVRNVAIAVGLPALRLFHRHAATSASTPMTLVELPSERNCVVIAWAKEPTPTGAKTWVAVWPSSCSSISLGIVL